jgi:hypothetical protein
MVELVSGIVYFVSKRLEAADAAVLPEHEVGKVAHLVQAFGGAKSMYILQQVGRQLIAVIIVVEGYTSQRFGYRLEQVGSCLPIQLGVDGACLYLLGV